MNTNPKSNTTPDNLIALPGGLSAQSTGAIVWWHLTGDTDIKRLQEAWEEQGLDPEWLPGLPSEKVALTRAVDDVIKSNRVRKKHRISDAHWSIFDVKADQESTEFQEQCRVALSDHKTPVVTPDTHPLAPQLSYHFNLHRAKLEARDIGTWLSTKMLDKVNAVSLRQNGGIYFVHRDHVETFQKVRLALKKATSHLMFEMQAMKNDEAVEAILFAITAEAEAQAQAVEADLDAHDQADEDAKGNGKMGGRALRTRHEQCEKMIKKVEAYEKLLDRSLADMRARLEDLAVSSMEAAMIADSEKERAKAEKKASGGS